MLFNRLPDEIFRPLVNKYRHLYAAALRRLREGLYSLDVTALPTRQAVIDELAEAIEEHLASLPPERVEEHRLTPQAAYAELVDTGWLSEHRDGWTVHAEMDMPVARLLDALCGLGEDAKETFGGTVVSVLSNLESAVEAPDTNAQGIAEAARRAKDFARYVRGVVGTLKDIERDMLAEASMNGMVRTFFEEFVARILIGDYRTLTSARNHPYRFRYHLLDLADRIAGDQDLQRTMAAALVAQGAVKDERAAIVGIQANIREVRLSMEAIDIFRARIDRTKTDIERRFANTLRYMDLVQSGRAERFAAALATLGRGLADLDGDEVLRLDTRLFEPSWPICVSRLAEPERPRSPVERRRFRQPEPDPLWLAFERAKQAFDRRITLTPEKFMRYVAGKLEGRELFSAADVPPEDIEEFLIFSALRALPVPRVPLPSGLVLEHRDGLVENDWLACRDFVIRRAAPSREFPG